MQSDSLPGSTALSKMLLFLASSLAFLALSLAFMAFITFSTMRLASAGCSSRYLDSAE